MSESADRGAALRTVLANDLPEAWNGLKWEQHEVGHYFRSICEHLGIDGEMVIRIQTCSGSCDKHAADALATLLEAAGIER